MHSFIALIPKRCVKVTESGNRSTIEVREESDMTSVVQSWVRVGKVQFGKGVFARQDIPNGTVLGQVEGQVIDDPNYATSYCIDLGGSFSLEPRAPYRFLNHCCTPNSTLCIAEVTYDDGSLAPSEITVEALMDIPKGAEITIDYRWAAFGAIKCLCGSPKCRGWVVAAEELPKLLRSKKRKPK
jgi:hypothetical protein